MSRKIRGKRVNAENRISRTSLVAVAVAVLVLGLVAAAFLYDSVNTESLQTEAAARQAALASQHSPTLGDPGAKVHIGVSRSGVWNLRYVLPDGQAVDVSGAW